MSSKRFNIEIFTQQKIVVDKRWEPFCLEWVDGWVNLYLFYYTLIHLLLPDNMDFCMYRKSSGSCISVDFHFGYHGKLCAFRSDFSLHKFGNQLFQLTRQMSLYRGEIILMRWIPNIRVGQISDHSKYLFRI